MKKDTNESFDLKNTTKYIRIGTYMGSLYKIAFKCYNCSNIWSITPNCILKGKGCPICAINKSKDTNESFDLKNTTKYIRVDNYIGSLTNIKFKCPDCLSLFSTRPSKILSGYGCPNCASTGFKLNKEAFLYVIQIDNFLKVGITNRNPIKRYKEITNKKVEEIKVIQGIGNYIRELEKKIHNNFKHYYPNDLKSGSTECFPLNLKTNILEYICFLTE